MLAVPFSHERHAPLRLDCKYCHVTAVSGEHASYPPAGVCAFCHPKMDLPAKEVPVEPEQSVYALAEFAIFSHARHAKAKIGCVKCHGDVYKMSSVEQVLPMTMKACVDCHKAMHAATGCKACHVLEQ